MDSLDSMIKKLAPLKVYKLENSNVYDELFAYSKGIDLLFESIDLLQKEAFIQTAESFGLLQREKIFDSGHPKYTVEKRREMLLGRMSTGQEHYTLQGVKSFIKSLGVESIITEHPKWREIYVEIIDSSLGSDRRAYIEKEIKKIMPLHHIVCVAFGNVSWDYLEKKNYTFAYFDVKDYTWEAINNFEV